MSSNLRAGTYQVGPTPPYQCQFADASRVSEFLDNSNALETDRNWKDFGFDTIQDYAFWAPRLCGIACIKMVIDSAAPNPSTSIAQLVKVGLELGGYVLEDGEGRFVDRGWFYKPLIEVARRFEVDGAVFERHSIGDVAAEIVAGRTVVASVHPGVIRGDLDRLPDGASGGHLVVVTGMKWDGTSCQGFYIHNPSGRTASTQANCFVAIDRFKSAFAGRGFSLWQP